MASRPSLLAGGGEKTCAYRKCGRLFSPRNSKQKYCQELCQQRTSWTRTVERRKKERFLVHGVCLECRIPIQRRMSKPGPPPKWCCPEHSHLYRSRRAMRNANRRNLLLDLGWTRKDDNAWVSPEGGNTVLFATACTYSGILKKPVKHEYTTDGVTVWVNGAGGLLGRFGLYGIDVHRPVEEQSLKGECLHCTHGLTGINEWHVFVRKMLQHYGINLTHDRYMPKRLKEKKNGIQEQKSV